MWVVVSPQPLSKGKQSGYRVLQRKQEPIAGKICASVSNFEQTPLLVEQLIQ